MKPEIPRIPASKQEASPEETYLSEGLSEEQIADLLSPDRQQEFRAAYLLQLKRLGCHGCGDDFIF
jgi:hypothetical protein